MKAILSLLIAFWMIGQAHAQGWSKLSSGTSRNLYSVYFTKPNTGFIAGDSLILKTVNSGLNWICTYKNCMFKSVHFLDSNIGYATGLPVYKTTDAGLNWIVNLTIPFSFYTSIFATAKDTAYMVGDIGRISITEDAGNTWFPYSLVQYTLYLRSIYFADKKTGFVVGWSGAICKSTDYGFTWKKTMFDTMQYLNCVYFPTNKIGYIAGFDSQSLILKTTDTGNTWVIQRPGSPNELNSVFFINADTGYAVGWYGTIIKTIDGGKHWTVQYSGTTQHLNSVFFTDANTGYIVGDSGVFLKTINGGSGLKNNNYVKSKIILFPNPSSGELNLKFNQNQNEIKVEITDIPGKLVYLTEAKEVSSLQMYLNLPKGLYYVSVFAEGNKTTFKLILE